MKKEKKVSSIQKISKNSRKNIHDGHSNAATAGSEYKIPEIPKNLDQLRSMEDLLREAEQIATGKLYDPIVVVTKRLILIGPDNIDHCFVALERHF